MKPSLADLIARDDVARILFDQRQTKHSFDDALDAAVESDAGTLLDICRDDADAVLRFLTPSGSASPAQEDHLGRVLDVLDGLFRKYDCELDESDTKVAQAARTYWLTPTTAPSTEQGD